MGIESTKKDTNLSSDGHSQPLSPSEKFGSTPRMLSLTRRRSSDTSRDPSWTPSSSFSSLRRRNSQPILATPLSTTKTNLSTTTKRLTKKKKHHQHLMESFRDFLEDLPATERSRRKQQQQQLEDELGDAMTALLNADPHFRCSEGLCPPVPHNDPIVFQPLISLRNWRRFQALFFYMKNYFVQLNPTIEIPAIGKKCIHNFFWNVRSSMGGLFLAFVGLSILFLGGTAISVVLVTMWTWKFFSVIGGLALSVLIDWNDVSKLMPIAIVTIFSSVVGVATWMDQILLFGKRYHGREWNQDGFELKHRANTAQSSQRGQYLLKLPPPTIQQIGLAPCADARHLKQREWSRDTADHVAAIEFCYLTMKNDFIPNQSDNLDRAVFQKSSGNVDDVTYVEDVKLGEFNGVHKSRKTRSSVDNVALQKMARQQSFSSDSVHENFEEPYSDHSVKIHSLRLEDVLGTDDDDESLNGDKRSTARRIYHLRFRVSS
jgi:hypothetical protein